MIVATTRWGILDAGPVAAGRQGHRAGLDIMAATQSVQYRLDTSCTRDRHRSDEKQEPQSGHKQASPWAGRPTRALIDNPLGTIGRHVMASGGVLREACSEASSDRSRAVGMHRSILASAGRNRRHSRHARSCQGEVTTFAALSVRSACRWRPILSGHFSAFPPVKWPYRWEMLDTYKAKVSFPTPSGS